MLARSVAALPERNGELKLPRKPNYSFEKRQRELAKAEKKAARLEAQARKRERKSCDGENQAGESAPETEETSRQG